MAYQPGTNLYTTVERLGRALGQRATDVTDNDELLVVLEETSRAIDLYCHSQFYVSVEARTFTPDQSGTLLIDNLVASPTNIPVIATDDGTRTYGTTWLATDYDLLPERAGSAFPPSPYWRINLAPYGVNYFSRYARGVRITAKWGHYEVLKRLSVTAGAMTDTAVTFTASAAPTMAQFGTGSTLLLGSEQVGVTAMSGTTITIARALNGTTAVAHLAATPIDVFTYPVIEWCCLTQAADDWRLRDTLGGAQASDEFGDIRQAHMWLPKVRQRLWSFRSGEAMAA